MDDIVTDAKLERSPRKYLCVVVQTRSDTQLLNKLSFSRWYNTQHKHSGLRFTTPVQRHTGEATAILEHRQQVYRLARDRNPNRWSGEIRNWKLPEMVWLNPEKELSELNQAA